MGISYLLWYFAVTNRKKDLTIIGPSPVKETIEKIFEFIQHPLNIVGGIKSLPFILHFKELTSENEVLDVQDKYKIRYAEMVHPISAFAYRIEKGMESVCYSGDTRPNQQLIELADKCDIFICESTFSDDQIQRASQTGHCTPSDAARMSREANCQKLVLVHISQHFEEAISKSINDIKKIFDKEIMLADDLMTLEINEK